jgi:hypothetical protein
MTDETIHFSEFPVGHNDPIFVEGDSVEIFMTQGYTILRYDILKDVALMSKPTEPEPI